MLIVGLVSLVATLLAVGIHFRLLSLLSSWLPKLRGLRRQRVSLGIVGALTAHMLEIAVFAGAMAVVDALPAGWNLGLLQSTEPGTAGDYLYWSAVCYTTMGYEHATPVGAIRLLVGVEALVGLVLVAWTASFLYLHMERDWSEHRGR